MGKLKVPVYLGLYPLQLSFGLERLQKISQIPVRHVLVLLSLISFAPTNL
jgi:hypothetical protein